MSQNKSYIDEAKRDLEKYLDENFPKGDPRRGGALMIFGVAMVWIQGAYSKGREDERHDDSPMGEGLFEGRKLKELSRPELYRAIGRFDGLYRSALQSHE